MTVVTLMKKVIWHDQESETVRQRLRDVDKARGMIQKVGSRGRVLNIERVSSTHLGHIKQQKLVFCIFVTTHKV